MELLHNVAMYETLDAGHDYGRGTEVMPALVAASSRFVGWSDAFKASRGVGPYSDAGLFASYIVDSMSAGDLSEVRAAFAAVEKLLESHDIDIGHVIGVGLLEPLVGMLADAALRSDTVTQMMGPRTTQD